MKKLFLFLFCLSFLCISNLISQTVLVAKEGQVPAEAKIEQMKWLSGYWKGQAFGGQIEEIWTKPKSGHMLGSFRLLSEGQLAFSELESIVESNGSLLLRIRHFGKGLVAWEDKEGAEQFALLKIEKDKAYFDGISIFKTGKKSLRMIVLDKKKDGRSEELIFDFKKERL